jgi:hypothetical protein
MIRTSCGGGHAVTYGVLGNSEGWLFESSFLEGQKIFENLRRRIKESGLEQSR